MNLPNIDKMFPQEEPGTDQECKYCGHELYDNEKSLLHCDDYYCSTDHLGSQLVKIGLAEWEYPGE